MNDQQAGVGNDRTQQSLQEAINTASTYDFVMSAGGSNTSVPSSMTAQSSTASPMDLSAIQNVLQSLDLKVVPRSEPNRQGRARGRTPRGTGDRGTDGRDSRFARIKCFACGGRGHMKSECPTVKNRWALDALSEEVLLAVGDREADLDEPADTDDVTASLDHSVAAAGEEDEGDVA